MLRTSASRVPRRRRASTARRAGITRAKSCAFDASLDDQLTRHFSLYISGRTICNDRDQQEAYAPGSPRYVKFAFEGEYGVTYQFGVKGTF